MIGRQEAARRQDRLDLTVPALGVHCSSEGRAVEDRAKAAHQGSNTHRSKFALWVDLVSVEGLAAVRAVPGFRDHSLKGEWQGHRAVRLSDAYRAIYTIHSEGWVEAVYVEEVNKHDY